ncbi:hypothetical protein BV372_29820 [Nostoc sp. T09]|nr:hypothetical protein BV372_29820 [Nostoc sp. T09]
MKSAVVKLTMFAKWLTAVFMSAEVIEKRVLCLLLVGIPEICLSSAGVFSMKGKGIFEQLAAG